MSPKKPVKPKFAGITFLLPESEKRVLEQEAIDAGHTTLAAYLREIVRNRKQAA